MTTTAENVKFRAGSYKVPGTLAYDEAEGLIVLGFRYNEKLLEEVKAFEGARWVPAKKKWTVKDTQRNRFQLRYLMCQNPYEPFDRPLVDCESSRPLYAHQLDMLRHALTRHYCILAAEMGTGKTLTAIELMEQSGFKDWYWVAPKSALRSVQLEFEKWRSRVRPRLFTYEGLTREMKNWPEGRKAPHGVVFDECSRVKNHTAQRSQAAMALADGVREDWGGEGYAVLMSGTPAPKSPADWWHQCEVACPGFLREGTYEKFKRRLGIVVMKESIQGGVYPQHVTWKDDVNKCGVCGMSQSHPCHDPISLVTGEHGEYHAFEPGKNEIEELYRRMDGLVLVKFKKDCLDLPEKRYEVIEVKPTPSTLRAASLIAAKCTTVIQTMTLLRELSDGFQYAEEADGVGPCPLCKGRKVVEAPKVDGAIEVTGENVEELAARYPDHAFVIGEDFTPPDAVADYSGEVSSEEVECPRCGGDGEVTRYRRTVTMVPCPKEDVVKELLDRYDDAGRTVFYGGFSGSVDRLEQVCLGQEWEVVRVDGRGWRASWGPVSELDMLRVFQNPGDPDHPRVAFVGQPSAAGMGLTLTASPMICFFSNDFNGESRWQAEDRIHRAGMDVNRGATIYDIVHLPTDRKVLENLQKKRELMEMSMGELKSVIDGAISGERAL